jgi:hypothetical protein
MEVIQQLEPQDSSPPRLHNLSKIQKKGALDSQGVALEKCLTFFTPSYDLQTHKQAAV